MSLHPGVALFPGVGVWPNTAQIIRGVFITPTVDIPFRMVPENRRSRLFGSLPHGLAVWRIDGVWHQGLAPSAETVAAADRFYGGGRIHPLDLDQIGELSAAGYGSYIQEGP